MSENNNQNQPHLDIELSEEIAEGTYSNLADHHTFTKRICDRFH